MRKWWKNLGTTWKVLIELATIAGVVLGGYAIYQTGWQHEDDQQQREQELTARLVQESPPYEKDGYTHVLFRNTAAQGTAVISTVWFVVDDPEQLQLIQRVYPKPKPQISLDEVPMCGAMIEPEDAFFRNGQWLDDGEFAYTCYDPRQAQQMEGIVLKLAIYDDKLAGKKLRGTVVLVYNGETQIQSQPLSINCYREKQDRDPRAQAPTKRVKRIRSVRR